MVLYGYVIMVVMFIVQSDRGELSDLIRDFKKFIAKTILRKKIQNSPGRKEWMWNDLN
jgi:hypothetical protein